MWEVILRNVEKNIVHHARNRVIYLNTILAKGTDLMSVLEWLAQYMVGACGRDRSE